MARRIEVIGQPAARLVIPPRGDGDADGAAVLAVDASNHKLVSYQRLDER